jgi:hypothetical protein
MPIASGARHGLRYVPESTTGVTPSTTPAALRHTTCSLMLTKESITSNELRDDRQIADMRMVGTKAGGDIGFELSFGEYDTLLEALFMGAWDDDELVSGVQMRSFTFERAFTDVGQYEVFTGCHVNQMTLSVQPNAMTTGTFSLVGKGAGFSASPLSASPTASKTGPVLDGMSGVLKEGGAQVAFITGIELTFANGIDPKFVVGSKVAEAFVPGRSNVTGKVSAFFLGPEMISKFIQETPSSLEITLGDGGVGSYKLLLPRIKYSGSDNPASDEGVIMLDMPFQALLDPVTGTNIKLTRITEE